MQAWHGEGLRRMIDQRGVFLVVTVAVVGVLHTIVPDHWVPIALLARQRGWSRGETARAAFLAGVGHTATTLALVAFGGWIAAQAWRDLRRGHGHGHPRGHAHRHGGGHRHGHGGSGGGAHGPELVRLGDVHHGALLSIHEDGGPPRFRVSGAEADGNGPPHVHWHDHTEEDAHDPAPGADAAPRGTATRTARRRAPRFC